MGRTSPPLFRHLFHECSQQLSGKKAVYALDSIYTWIPYWEVVASSASQRTAMPRFAANFGGCGDGFFDDGVNVGLGGAVIDEARAESEASVDGGVGDVNATALDNALHEAGVESVIAIAPTPAHGAEGDGGEKFETVILLDEGGEKLGVMKILMDGFAECVETVVAEREPDFERAKTARQ